MSTTGDDADDDDRADERNLRRHYVQLQINTQSSRELHRGQREALVRNKGKEKQNRLRSVRDHHQHFARLDTASLAGCLADL